MKKLLFISLIAILSLNLKAQISFNVDNSYGCAPLLVNFTNTSTIDTTGVKFTWSIYDNTTQEVSYNFQHTFQYAKNYYVNLVARDEFGSYIGSYGMYINVDGNAGFINNNSGESICPNSYTYFFAASNYWNLSWDMGDGTLYNNTGNANHSYVNPGDYIVTLTGEGSCGIDIIKDTIHVGNDAIPSVNAYSHSGSTFCANDDVIFASNNSLTSYLWNFGDGNFSVKSNPSHAFTNEGNYNIVLRGGNSCGNYAWDTISVSIQSGIPAYSNINVWNTNICPNNDIQLQTTSSGTLTWDLGNSITKTEREFMYSYPDTGAYQISLIVNNSCGDADTSYQTIYVYYDLNNKPNASAYFVDYRNWDNNSNPINTITVCPNTEVSFMNDSYSSGNITEFFWDFGDGTTATTDDASHVFTNIGNNTVTFIVTTSCGAKDTTYKYINVDASEMPNTSLQNLPDTICPGEKVYFYDQNYNSNYTYNIWFGDNDSLINILGLTTDVEVLAAHTYTNAGTYNFLMTATNSCANTDTLQGSIIVDGTGLSTPFYYVMNSTMNERNQNNFNDFSKSNTGLEHEFIIPVDFPAWNSSVSDTVYYVFWYGGMNVLLGDPGNPAGVAIHDGFNAGSAFVPVNGNDSVIVAAVWWCTGEIGDNPQAMKFSTQAYALTEGAQTTIDTLQLSGWDGNCTASQNPSAGCPGDSVMFVALGGVSHEWHLPSGAIVNSSSAKELFPNAGLFDAYVVITNGCGGKDTIHSQVEIVNDNIPQNNWFDYNNSGCANDTVYFEDRNSENGGYTYSWDFGDGNSSSEKNPTHVYTNFGEYNVELTITNGCGSAPNTKTVWINGPSVEVSKYNGCIGQNNGSISTNITNGWWPMTYNWSTTETSSSIDNLTPGTYSLTVTDNGGCKFIQSYEIQPNPAIDIALNISNVTCNGNSDGEIEAIPSNGTAPYYYFWETENNSSIYSGFSAGMHNVGVVDNNACTASKTGEVLEPAVLSSLISGTNVFCKGTATGSINLTVSGGTTPYSFIWSNGKTTEDIVALIAGTYNVTITDKNGCQTTNSITITEPSEVLTATLTLKSDATCGNNDGSIDISVSGGTTPYDYSWSSGEITEDISSLSANIYYLTVSDYKACQSIISVSIENAGAPIISVDNVKNLNCFGGHDGAIDISISGGTPDYTVTWSDGLGSALSQNNLFGQTYTVYVTDVLNCAAVKAITINAPELLEVNLNKSNIYCYGDITGSVSSIVIGGTTPYNYNWSSGQATADITNLSADNYSVTVTDSLMCQAISEVVSISEPDSIKIEYIVTSASCGTCADGSIDITVTGGTPIYSYSWSNSETSEDISALLPGVYEVTVSDLHLCENTKSITVDFSTSIKDVENNSIKVFPNPTNKGYFVVKMDKISENTNVELVDLSGKSIVKYNSIKNSEFKVNTQNIESGIYFVRIVNNVNSVVRKIVIE